MGRVLWSHRKQANFEPARNSLQTYVYYLTVHSRCVPGPLPSPDSDLGQTANSRLSPPEQNKSGPTRAVPGKTGRLLGVAPPQLSIGYPLKGTPTRVDVGARAHSERYNSGASLSPSKFRITRNNKRGGTLFPSSHATGDTAACRIRLEVFLIINFEGMAPVLAPDNRR